MVKITLVKSLIGERPNTVATAKSLALKKIGSYKVLPNTPATQGKIKVLAHLVKVEEIAE